MYWPSKELLFAFRAGLGKALDLFLKAKPTGPEPQWAGSISEKRLDHLAPSKAVYLVASPLSFTAPQRVFAKYPGGAFLFSTLTSINTMHWGLKIGDDLFADLKHLPDGKIGCEFAEPATRNENEVLLKVYLGVTHFEDAESMVFLGK
ncbi:hypothetical protein LTS08_008795 [Lithohypha guttulata]|nr:hypothetical protein LTS08_008795 [Lithohypha guttulata]